MLSLALLLCAGGIFCSYLGRVLILFPATLIAWAATASFCVHANISTGETILAAFLGGAGLQLAYLAGAACLPPSTPIRKNAVAMARDKVRRFRA
jgi:hypothetical protein